VRWEHDPEKWELLFGKDHAKTGIQSMIRPEQSEDRQDYAAKANR
jgi:hypothetical protein